MTNVTLMNVDNGYVLNYQDEIHTPKTYIFKSLKETFDFIARLYNDIEYYNEQLESVRPYQDETITGDSLKSQC